MDYSYRLSTFACAIEIHQIYWIFSLKLTFIQWLAN